MVMFGFSDLDQKLPFPGKFGKKKFTFLICLFILKFSTKAKANILNSNILNT